MDMESVVPSPSSPSTAVVHTPRRPPLRLLASAVSPSPAATQRFFSTAHHVVRGVRSTLCFGGSNNGGPLSSSVACQQPATPESAAQALWSPSTQALSPTRRKRLPIEHSVRGLFSALGEKPAAADVGEAKPPEEPKCESPAPVCCICLEDMSTTKRAHQLRCPQCTMQAHSKCLAKWFHSEASATAARERATNRTLNGAQNGLDPPAAPPPSATLARPAVDGSRVASPLTMYGSRR